MVLLVVALTLGAIAIGLVVALAFGRGRALHVDAPPWQEITGLVVMGLALVLMVVGLVLQLRGNRRLRVWSQPFAVLTRGQRKELAAMVRGRAPVREDRLPLARYMAEATVHLRTQVTAQIGLLLLFAGQWLTTPGTARLVIVLGYAALLAVAIPFFRRGAARAQRFLDAHPTEVEA
jgi:hypothetical protein